MKIAFGMIVLNGNYVLEECIKSVYPYANQILIAEGPVTYWQQQGLSKSTDGTIEVLNSIPDPENKIQIVSSQYQEKDHQCNTYMKLLDEDNDYIWNLDCDEIFKSRDIETIMEVLEEFKITSVGFRSRSFYGGFDNVLGGFEEGAEFMRIRKVYPGSYWATHRTPTIAHTIPIHERLPERHLDHNTLDEKLGVRMYHYSYVFPQQVKQKVSYYKAAVSKQNCIDDYFENVYLPWVTGSQSTRSRIEEEYDGVHEFKPSVRGSCRTKPFEEEHTEIILQNMDKMKKKFEDQLNEFRTH